MTLVAGLPYLVGNGLRVGAGVLLEVQVADVVWASVKVKVIHSNDKHTNIIILLYLTWQLISALALFQYILCLEYSQTTCMNT